MGGGEEREVAKRLIVTVVDASSDRSVVWGVVSDALDSV